MRSESCWLFQNKTLWPPWSFLDPLCPPSAKTPPRSPSSPLLHPCWRCFNMNRGPNLRSHVRGKGQYHMIRPYSPGIALVCPMAKPRPVSKLHSIVSFFWHQNYLKGL